MGTIVEDFKLKGEWVRSYREGGRQFFTRSYKVWCDMRQRCKLGGKWQSKYPTYVGCTMSEQFSNPDNFIEWSTKQPGGGKDGYQLDKDLLCKNNKIYCEDFCVYLPQALNKFLTDKRSSRGEFPRGVHYNSVVGKLCAKVCIGGKNTHLGYFESPDEAYTAYKVAKEQEARRWLNSLMTGEFTVDERVLHALSVYSLPSDYREEM